MVGIIVGVVVGAVALIVAVSLIVGYLMWKKRREAAGETFDVPMQNRWPPSSEN